MRVLPVSRLSKCWGSMHSQCKSGAMGKSSDPNAVVDIHGMVYGVEGLRIVDASIFPSLPPGHIQATVLFPSVIQMLLPG